MRQFDYGPPEDCSEAFRKAENAEEAYYTAQERADNAGNPLTRFYFVAVAALRKGDAFDSHEHAEMIADLQALTPDTD